MNNSDKIKKILESNYFSDFLKNNAKKTIVMKFGGSVLESNYSYECLAKLANQLRINEINAYLILSAKKGRTNELIAENGKEELGYLLKSYDNKLIHESKYNTPIIAEKLLMGEIESVNELSSILERNGLEHKTFIQGSGEFPIIANGNYLNAEILINESILKSKKLESLKGIIIIPGFGAENLNCEKVLLGRNSSDLIAAMIAKLDLRVNELIYVKDVCGILENFNCENQRLIETISSKELIKKKIEQVLDSRVFEWQRCPIRVTDLLNPGTIII